MSNTDEGMVYLAFAVFVVAVIVTAALAIKEARRRHRELMKFYRKPPHA